MRRSLSVEFSAPTATKSTPMNQTTTQFAADTKYSPAHYKQGNYEVWDFIVDQDLDYLSGNIIKYICRAGYKPNESELDDWLKIRAYVDRKIRALSDAQPPHSGYPVPAGDGAAHFHT
jgi:hypothetical protein